MSRTYVISVLFLLCFRARLFIDALWSPAGEGLASWLVPDCTQTDQVPVASDQTEHFTFVGESSESCTISVVGEQKEASIDADDPQLKAVEVPPDKLEDNTKTADKKEELILAVK